MTNTIYVEGMTCNNCVRHVEEALKELEGVKSVKVDLKAKKADIELSAEVSDQQITEAIEDAGYDVSSIK
ncbi:MAG: heavy-metal-associated domain-containing protein [Clostridiales bacterium]|nr:heavy-metal-associated domain-containing protein [Clostridiales bacterium]